MNREKMAAIYDKYHSAVYRVALSYCRNVQDAEDITQDVFLKRFSKEYLFLDDAKEKSWLLRVTVNLCKNLLKARKRHNTVPLEDAAGVCVTPEEYTVWDAVDALPPKYRLVIQLYYGEGYSVAEIAAITKHSKTAVQTQLYRARRQLGAALGEEDAE